MNRLAELKNEIDFHLWSVEDAKKTEAIRHLYGVSDMCALLAYRRSMDVTLCIVSGMLHDLWLFKSGKSDNHASHGAKLAQLILEELRTFDDGDIAVIVEAIKNHSNKGEEHDEYSEVLKDSDVLSAYLTNPEQKFSKSKVQRIKRAMRELGINIKVQKK